MSTRRLIALVTAGLLGFLPILSLGQQGTTPGVIRINVNLVQVDAVVTDSKGNPVTDLTADDFEVYQDGQRQLISSVEFVRARQLPPDVDPILEVVTPLSTGNIAPPPKVTVLKPEDIRRTVALVVDDLGLSFDSVVRVRDSLKKWVDKEMQPGDLAAVVRTSAGMGSLQQFTMDKQILYTAIDQIRFNLGRVGTSSFTPLPGALPTDGVIDTRAFDDEVQYNYLIGSLGAIQYVVRGLRELPGRKSMILFSESMRFTYLQGDGLVPTTSLTLATGEERMRRLVDEANRSSVVIYAIDPRGVIYDGLTAEDNAGNLVPAGEVVSEDTSGDAAAADAAPTGEADSPAVPNGFAQAVSNRSQQLITSRDGMFELTSRTGGLFLRDTNDIAGALRQAVDDGDGYYLIGYQPDAFTFEESGSPRFHKISVRVKRSGLKVRSRSGFLGSPDNQALPPEQAQRMQLTRALVSPFSTGDIRVHLTGLYFPTAEGDPAVRVLLHFDTRDLAFTEDTDGSRKAKVDIAAVTFDADGEPLNTVASTTNITVPASDFERVTRQGLVYSTDLPIKKPGGYQLRVVLRDSGSQKLGSAMQFIEVPDVKKGRLTVSGIVLAEAPKPAANNPTPDSTTVSSPALRVFEAGDDILYAYEILNARPDADKKTQLDSQVRLFRDGKLVFLGALSRLSAGEDLTSTKRLTATGRLQLSKIQPGNYVMQIVVMDNQRFDKYRIATQATDFEIRP